MLRIAARIVGPARGHTGPYIAGLMGLTGPRRHSGRRYTGRRGPRLDNNHIHRETHNANRKDAAYYAGMSTEGSRGSSRRRAYLPFSANDLCMCVCVKGSEFISSTLFELPSNRETLAALSRSYNLFRLRMHTGMHADEVDNVGGGGRRDAAQGIHNTDGIQRRGGS